MKTVISKLRNVVLSWYFNANLNSTRGGITSAWLKLKEYEETEKYYVGQLERYGLAEKPSSRSWFARLMFGD